MVRFNYLFVVVGALLAASVASFEHDVSAARAVAGAASLMDDTYEISPSRDLLQRRRRRRNRRNRRTNKKKGDGGLPSGGKVNVNGEGVLYNQEVSANIHGSSNVVAGGVIAPTFNANVDIDEIAYDRRRLRHLVNLAGKGDPSASRDLLQRRRRRSRRGGKGKKQDSHKAFGSVNGEGVLVNQHVSAKIDGDSNTVKGGYVSDIENINLSVDEVHSYSP